VVGAVVARGVDVVVDAVAVLVSVGRSPQSFGRRRSLVSAMYSRRTLLSLLITRAMRGEPSCQA
jgi:hypothetical protein